jgi:dolichol kinase
MPIPLRAELGRKLLHVLTALVPLFLLRVDRPVVIGLAAFYTALTVAGDVLRARSAAFAGFIRRAFGWMMRAEEHPDVTGPVVLNGATWVGLGALLLVGAFPMRVAAPVFVAFMLADAAAALVGRTLGRHRWPGTPRTFEGSLAFWAVAFGVLVGLPAAGVAVAVPAWPAALLVGATMALAEALPLPLNDNLRVPFVGALLLWAMGA